MKRRRILSWVLFNLLLLTVATTFYINPIGVAVAEETSFENGEVEHYYENFTTYSQTPLHFHENLSLCVLYENGSYFSDVAWNSIVWGQVSRVGIKNEMAIVGFEKAYGSVLWYPYCPRANKTYEKPLWFTFQRFWAKVGGAWYKKYITIDVAKTPFVKMQNNTFEYVDWNGTVWMLRNYTWLLGWSGTINYAGHDFPVSVGIESNQLLPVAKLKTNVTTPINLEDHAIEYQMYLNPYYIDKAEKNIRYLRVYFSNGTAKDYNITQFMDVTTEIPNMAHKFSFLTQNKSLEINVFNFADVFKRGVQKFAKIESVVLPNGAETYVVKIGATFGSLNAGETMVIDPSYEDFTTYTEVDPNSQLSVTSSRVTADDFDRSADAYVYCDKGSNHFSGDFEHLVTVKPISYGGSTHWPAASIWSLFNSVNSYDDAGDGLWVKLARTGVPKGNKPAFRLYERSSATEYYDCQAEHGVQLEWNTTYYLTIKRNESIGTYGRVYCYIYNSSARTSEYLEDTCQLDLHEKQDLQYIYAVQSIDDIPDGLDDMDFYVENLDLQEPPTNDACDSDSNFLTDMYGWVNITVSTGVADLKEVKIKSFNAHDSNYNFTLNWTQSSYSFAEISDPQGMCTLGTSYNITVDADTVKTCFNFTITGGKTGAYKVTVTSTDDSGLTDTDTYTKFVYNAVGRSGSSTAIAYLHQRKTFYDTNGRFWVFYFPGGNVAYKSSADNVTWSELTTVRSCASGYMFSVWYDGATKVHYVYAEGNGDSTHQNTPVYYRRGTISGSTITWDDSEQIAVAAVADAEFCFPTVCVDSLGYPWVGYGYNGPLMQDSGQVSKSEWNNGSWSTETGFPHDVTAVGLNWYFTTVVPLTDNKIYALCNQAGTAFNGTLWNGTSWGSFEAVGGNSTLISASYTYSAVALDDDVHLVFQWGSPSNVSHSKRTYSTGTWSETPVCSNNVVLRGLTRVPNNWLYCFYGKTGTDWVYYKIYNGSWSAESSWFTMSDIKDSGSSYENFGGKICFVYRTEGSSPYVIRHNYLAVTSKFDVNLRTLDNGSNVLTQATVYMNDGTQHSQQVSAQGWANWTNIDKNTNVSVYATWYGITVNTTFYVLVDGDKAVDVNCLAYPFGSQHVASNATISSVSWASSILTVKFSSGVATYAMKASGSKPTYVMNCSYDLTTDYTTILNLTHYSNTTIKVSYENWGDTYLQQVDHRLTSTSWSDQKLRMYIDGASGTGTLKIYCGSRGRPQTDFGFTSSSYASQVFTGTYALASQVYVWVDWATEAGGEPGGGSAGESGISRLIVDFPVQTLQTILVAKQTTVELTFVFDRSNLIFLDAIEFGEHQDWFTIQQHLPMRIVKAEEGEKTVTIQLMAYIPEGTQTRTYRIPCKLTITDGTTEHAVNSYLEFTVAQPAGVPEYMAYVFLAMIAIFFIGTITYKKTKT